MKATTGLTADLAIIDAPIIGLARDMQGDAAIPLRHVARRGSRAVSDRDHDGVNAHGAPF
jgi:hypothetical protein